MAKERLYSAKQASKIKIELDKEGLKYNIQKRVQTKIVYYIVSTKKLKQSRQIKVKKRSMSVVRVFENKRKARKILTYMKKKYPKIPLYILKKQKKHNRYAFELVDESLFEWNLSPGHARAVFSQDANEYSSQFYDIKTGLDFQINSLQLRTNVRTESLIEKNSRANISETRVGLDEFYGKWNSDSFSFTLGRQLFSWGIFDEFSQFDRVSFRNINRFPFDVQDMYRRPITAARLTSYIGSLTIDSFLEFVSEEDRFLSKNANFSPIAESTFPLIEVPRQEASYGIRVKSFGALEYSLNFMRAPTLLPVVYLNESFELETTYPNEELMGLDVVHSLGDSLLKFEYAYFSKAIGVNEDLSLVLGKRNSFSIGLDSYFSFLDFNWNFQARSEDFVDDDSGESTKSSIFISELRKKFLAEKLTIGLRNIIFGDDGSGYQKVFLGYTYSDSLDFELSQHSFDGRADTTFGVFAEKDYVDFSFKYLF